MRRSRLVDPSATSHTFPKVNLQCLARPRSLRCSPNIHRRSLHNVSPTGIRVEIIVRHPFPSFFAFGAELIGTDYSAWYTELERLKLHVRLITLRKTLFCVSGATAWNPLLRTVLAPNGRAQGRLETGEKTAQWRYRGRDDTDARFHVGPDGNVCAIVLQPVSLKCPPPETRGDSHNISVVWL
jgi:hypothetical protein